MSLKCHLNVPCASIPPLRPTDTSLKATLQLFTDTWLTNYILFLQPAVRMFAVSSSDFLGLLAGSDRSHC